MIWSVTISRSICAVAGAAALVGALCSASAARADQDDWRYRRNDRIETDRRILREDEERLSRLERRLDHEIDEHDRREAREVRHQIDRARADVNRDRRQLDRDMRHDRDWR